MVCSVFYDEVYELVTHINQLFLNEQTFNNVEGRKRNNTEKQNKFYIQIITIFLLLVAISHKTIVVLYTGYIII